MQRSDPVTRLTPEEQALVAEIDATSDRKTVLAELKANLQTAVEIELATIPIYLYSYYSIVRNATSGENIDRLQAYANKAGGVTMSVAVEEMLHMSLSSNILYAMGVAPQLYRKAPKKYPTPLPYHRPKGPPGPDGKTAVLIPLAKHSFEQLWHFLQIEYPEQWDALPQDRNWQTIGQFYSYIRCLIHTKFVTDADFQQGAAAAAIQPYNYSPNNVDTVYPTGKFDPWKPAPPAERPDWAKPDRYPGAAEAAVFADKGDSHAGATELVTVASIADAACAIDTICDQGEGYPVPYLGPGADDDPSKDEESHYVKFLKLQAQYADYAGCTETLPADPPPPALLLPTVTDADLGQAGFVVNMPENPTLGSYPPEYRPIADFCSACFQYMLIMTETIYKVPPQSQKLFFNEGLHRSMIWVLDKYIRTIRQLPLDKEGKLFMGPLFEDVDLGQRKGSFKTLTRKGAEAIAAANKLTAELNKRIAALQARLPKDDPAQKKADQAQITLDQNTVDALGNVIWYVGVATPQPGGQVGGHLPDVAPYWTA